MGINLKLEGIPKWTPYLFSYLLAYFRPINQCSAKINKNWPLPSITRATSTCVKMTCKRLAYVIALSFDSLSNKSLFFYTCKNNGKLSLMLFWQNNVVSTLLSFSTWKISFFSTTLGDCVSRGWKLPAAPEVRKELLPSSNGDAIIIELRAPNWKNGQYFKWECIYCKSSDISRTWFKLV